MDLGQQSFVLAKRFQHGQTLSFYEPVVKEHKLLVFHLVDEVVVYHKIFLVTFVDERRLGIIDFSVLEYWVFAVFGDLIEFVLFLYVSYKCLYGLEILATFIVIVYIFAHLLLHGHSFEQLLGG